VRQAVGAKAMKNQLAAERQEWRAPRRRGRSGRAARRVKGSACAAAARRAQQGAVGVPAAAGGSMAPKTSYDLERVAVDTLEKRPGLAGLAAMLGMQDADTIPVLKNARIDAVFECGTVREQLLRASPDYRGKPWYDSVRYQPSEGVAEYCIGEVRAIVRTADGDKVVIVEMVPVAGEPGCPLVQRGCTRLRWHRRDEEADCAVRLVPLACVRWLVHVVPDFAELAARRGFEPLPAALGGPLVERLAMRYFVNVFYPWDA